MNAKKILKKSSNMVAREIEGKIIFMPLSRSSKNINCIYTLNETAAAAWNIIDGKISLGEIKDKLMAKFNVKEKTLEKELDQFAKDLKSMGAIA